MDVGADVTWARGRFVSSGSPIPGAPPLIVTAKASMAHPKGFRAGVRWFVIGARPLSYGAVAGNPFTARIALTLHFDAMGRNKTAGR